MKLLEYLISSINFKATGESPLIQPGWPGTRGMRWSRCPRSHHDSPRGWGGRGLGRAPGWAGPGVTDKER